MDNDFAKKNHLFGWRLIFISAAYVNKRKWRVKKPERNYQEANDASSENDNLANIADRWAIFFFFENPTGNTILINGERYRGILTNFLWPEIDNLNLDDFW